MSNPHPSPSPAAMVLLWPFPLGVTATERYVKGWGRIWDSVLESRRSRITSRPLEGLSLSIFCPEHPYSFAVLVQQSSGVRFVPNLSDAGGLVLLTKIRCKQVQFSYPHTQPLCLPCFGVLLPPPSSSILPCCSLDLLCPHFSLCVVSRGSLPLSFASDFAKHCGMTRGRVLASSLQGSRGLETLQHPWGACPSLHPLMCLCVSACRSCLVAVLHQTPTPDPQRISQKGKIGSLYQ